MKERKPHIPFYKRLTPEMTRPVIYEAISRLLCAICAALLLAKLLTNSVNVKSTVFLLCALLFFGAAWVVELRLDGIMIPMLSKIKLRISKTPKQASYGDMIDHVDDDHPTTFDDLDEEQKDGVRLIANISCCVITLILSFLWK